MSDAEILQRLDTLINITRLAHADRIEQVRRDTRSDAVNAAILDAATDWVGAGELKTQVAKATSQSERTVARRLSDLVADGILAQQGAGPSIKYRTTGLI